MAYRAVLFDGYGTLFAEGMERLVATSGDIAREVGLDLDGPAFLDRWDGHFFPLIREGSFVNFRVAHEVSLQKVLGELGVAGDASAMVDRLFSALGSVPAFGDVKPALRRLDGTATGVVSNADTDHLTDALIRNGLSFELVVSSESARAYKPDPAIFRDALSFFGCDPRDVLYVGDSQEDDIVGARRAGIAVAWLNRDGADRRAGIPEPDYEIRGLEEVAEIVSGRSPGARKGGAGGGTDPHRPVGPSV
jgi:2-haloalkanoic acid dehalogenase type II